MKSPARAVTFDLDFGRIAALEWGPADGKPVLALHGWLDNAASFEGLASYLPECRLVAFDLPGHGLSDHRPVGGIYHLIDGASDLLQVADALGWDRPCWLGHSMGGAIAALAAGAAPNRVDRLALVESLGPLVDPAAAAPDRLAAHLKDRISYGSKRMPFYPDLETAVRARMTAGDLSMESARLLAERGTKITPDGLTWRSDPRLRLSSPIRLTEDQVQGFLARIECPTLVVSASKGLVPIRASLASRMANLRQGLLETVEGGHHVHLDHPDRVAPALRRLLGLTP